MIAVDTNILVYAEGVGDPQRSARANYVLDKIEREEFVAPAQVLAELFRVLGKRTQLSFPDVRVKVARWEEFALVVPTMLSTLASAFDLASEHRFQVFDAIIVAASVEAECRMLLSEDMHDGFVWHGVTIVNPFAAQPHPMLADLMRR